MPLIFRRRSSCTRTLVLIGAGLALLAAVTARAPSSSAAGQVGDSLPDLKIMVPINLISIGVDPSSGARQLRFTHITADIGSGPFEIDPTYDASTGTSTFTQAIYRSPRPGVWVLDRRVPVAAAGTWHPPSDYEFPLTQFTLRRATGDGTLGATVATSPKSAYCITGDVRVGGVANTPDQTSIPASNCTDPTQPLGWSVGWGDQYDQTDSGQPIDLTGIADGTYVLHAVVDPRHVFTESNTSNDVTDTTLRISGDNVTVLAQSAPGTTPPQVTVTAPRSGSTVSGTVILRASASAQAPAAVRSVQFLIDGQPLGGPVRDAPFAYAWTVGSTPPGRHYLSARATDSGGNVASAPPVALLVRRLPSLRVRSLRWKRGVLTVLVSGVPPGATLRAELVFPRRAPRYVTVHRERLRLRTARPRAIGLRTSLAGHEIGRTVTVSLDGVPTITIANPLARETVSGIAPISASAMDGVAVSSVQFSVDGRRLSRPLTRPPFALLWDTRKLRNGTHTLAARATNVMGNSRTARTVVTVQNPAPPMTCFVLQAQVSARGKDTVTTAGFHTAMRGETLLAFLAADGPAGAGTQTATVTGGGLRWRLVKRANASSGDSEIWTATAPRILTATSVTARLAATGFDALLTVVAMEGADGVGAAAAASAPSGPPTLRLTTRSATSLVFAVGNDWERAVTRVLPVGWVSLNQWLNQQTGDTFWSQYTNQPTGRRGAVVNVRDLAPTNDSWNLAAVELVNSGG